jgi:hypothetical protein
MLCKCANSSCFASFSRLDEGKLFQLENAQTVGASTNSTEYFWLCSNCSAGMTLRLSQDGRVGPTGRPEAIYGGPQVALISLNRENGLCLRSVSFLRSSHPSGT